MKPEMKVSFNRDEDHHESYDEEVSDADARGFIGSLIVFGSVALVVVIGVLAAFWYLKTKIGA